MRAIIPKIDENPAHLSEWLASPSPPRMLPSLCLLSSQKNVLLSTAHPSEHDPGRMSSARRCASLFLPSGLAFSPCLSRLALVCETRSNQKKPRVPVARLAIPRHSPAPLAIPCRTGRSFDAAFCLFGLVCTCGLKRSTPARKRATRTRLAGLKTRRGCSLGWLVRLLAKKSHQLPRKPPRGGFSASWLLPIVHLQVGPL